MPTKPRNVFQYCLRCGSTAVYYAEDDSLHCEACDFHYFVNSAAAVAALITNEQGELLLTKRAFNPEKGKLDLPGGFVDIGESAEQTLVRELEEELNVRPEKIRYIHSYPNEYIYGGLTVYTLDMAFECEIVTFEKLKANDDVAEFAFYSLQNIDLEEIALDSIRVIVSDFVKTHT